MDSTKAKKIGRSKSLATIGIVLIVVQLFRLLIATNGDFANGILFYLEQNLDVISLLFMGLLCFSYFILGGISAQEIFTKKKNVTVLSLRNAIVTILPYLVTLFLDTLLTKDFNFEPSFSLKKTSEAITRDLSILLPISFLIWLTITFQLKRRVSTKT